MASRVARGNKFPHVAEAPHSAEWKSFYRQVEDLALNLLLYKYVECGKLGMVLESFEA